MSRRERRHRPFGACAGLVLLALAAGCASAPEQPPLEALDRPIELERFMGPWYVVAAIPIDVPFFGEEEAYSAVERYELRDDGRIDITYTFRDGGFDGKRRELHPKAWVHDEELGTEWRVRFLWPFESAYLIAWLDEDYQRAIIGVPDRDYAWILSRDAPLPDAELDALAGHLVDLGYELDGLRRVPHRASEDGAAATASDAR